MHHLTVVGLILLACVGCAGPSAEQAKPSSTASDQPTGTWANQARTRAAFDLNCSEASVKLSYIKKADWSAGPVFGARGCGKRASYSADTRNGVVLQSQVSQDSRSAAAATSP